MNRIEFDHSLLSEQTFLERTYLAGLSETIFLVVGFEYGVGEELCAALLLCLLRWFCANKCRVSVGGVVLCDDLAWRRGLVVFARFLSRAFAHRVLQFVKK